VCIESTFARVRARLHACAVRVCSYACAVCKEELTFA
jgi:hypothetical protein